MSDKKKIAFVGNTSFSMYNFRLGVLRKLAEKHDVVVIAPEDEYSELLKQEGIGHIPITIDSKGTNVFNDLRLIKTLYQIYKAEKFDLIFHFTIKILIYGSLICSIKKIKSIAFTTGLGIVFTKDNLRSKIVKMMYKTALRGVCEVWFLNHDDWSLFVDGNIVPKEKTCIIPSEGVNSDYYCPMESSKKDGKFRFLLCSRLFGEKGVREFVSAARDLKRKYPDMLFTLLGKCDKGTGSDITAEEIDGWVNEGIIEHMGYAIEVRQFIADSDCVVLPSYYREGVPRCLMEAMSMEKPIVTTNNVGCVEVIEDGVNGYMCEPRSADNLREKMERLYLLSEEDRLAMGKAGRNIIKEKFDEKIIIAKYEERISKYL